MSFEICLSEINVPRLLIRSINFLRSEAKILPSIIVLNQWATFPSECHSCHFLLTAQNFSWDVICQESKNKKKILHLSVSNDTVLVVFDVFNSDIKVFDRFLFVLKGYFWIYGKLLIISWQNADCLMTHSTCDIAPRWKCVGASITAHMKLHRNCQFLWILPLCSIGNTVLPILLALRVCSLLKNFESKLYLYRIFLF